MGAIRGNVWRRMWLLCLLGCLFVVSGCGGGGTTQEFITPPRPQQGQTMLDPFFVVTPNYFTLYTSTTAPFPRGSQFAEQHYPVPVSYQTETGGPSGFNLQLESERAFLLWAQADPRVTVLSGVNPGSERISIILTDRISYGGMNNILGLTKMLSGGGNPRFEVLIAALDPLTNTPLTTVELDKTIAHELGHTIGLGHAPDQRDLMYYRSNDQQGVMPRSFLTLGDALTIWTTLSDRQISWHQSRPTITPAGTGTTRYTGGRAVRHVTDEGGVVIDVYTP